MGTVSVSEDRETKFAVAIAEQERCITREAPAVRKIAIPISDFAPPRQPEPSSFVTPDPFYPALELIELSRHHLVHRRLADNAVSLKHTSIQIRDQPIRLVQNRAVDDARGKYRGPDT